MNPELILHSGDKQDCNVWCKQHSDVNKELEQYNLQTHAIICMAGHLADDLENCKGEYCKTCNPEKRNPLCFYYKK